MPILVKTNVFVLVMAVALLLMSSIGFASNAAELTKVTRIENVTAVMKGRNLIIHSDGMATTGLLPAGGKLLRHGPEHQLNKDGLLEYDLCFKSPKNPGEKLRPVKASLKESSVPAGLKGVRVYAEYNHLDGTLPEPKQKKPKEKK